MAISDALKNQLLDYQRNEITEYHIYRKLAARVKSPDNRRVLEDIAEEERQHYETWKQYTGEDVGPDRLRIWFYYLVSVILGVTFGVKLMERNEEDAQANYEPLCEELPRAEVTDIIEQETEHEEALLDMLEEQRLRYVGSMVLGLNDALVELTGALAGLTLALQNTRLIALAGAITGIAAAMSMAASEYLSTKASPEENKHPVIASVYTGMAYLVTVLILLLPYLVFADYYAALGLTLVFAVTIIAVFNFYIAVANDEPFLHRFTEMAVLSLSIAGLSFLLGYVLRTVFGVDV